MSAPANGAKVLRVRKTGSMSTAIVGIAGRTAMKFRNLKITALLLEVAAS